MSNICGYIYIFFNPAMPGLVKIGFAADVEQRLRKANESEFLPFAFRCYATYAVCSEMTDKELHRLIDALSPDLRSIEDVGGRRRVREFYSFSPKEAFSLLEAIAKISSTEDRLKLWDPDEQEKRDVELAQTIVRRQRRQSIRFSAIGIPSGSELVYTEDPSIKVTVLDDRHILYRDQTTSMSALAQELLNSAHSVQGSLYFSYNGERLTDRRVRLEREQLLQGEAT